MNLLPFNWSAGELVTLPAIDSRYKKHIIGGAIGSTIKGAFGVILKQLVDYDILTFTYYVIVLSIDTILQVDTSDFLLSLTYMLENEITQSVDGSSIALSLSEGQFQLAGLPPDQYLMALTPGIYRFCRLDVKRDVLSEFSQQYDFLKEVALRAEHNLPVVYQKAPVISHRNRLLLDSILANKVNGTIGHITIESSSKRLLLLSLNDLEEQFRKYPVLGSDREEYEKIKAFITNNLDKKLTIPLLCSHFKIGKTKMQQLFSQLSMMSVHDFITIQKIERSKLLLETSLTINEVAIEVGYTEPSNFIRAFKKITGMTPMVYKANNGQIDY
ncbi:helix-turn-helix transcriptional regulator [Chitinophaga agrisoli]|uniref:Helix-turn-helix transcriptional regulator n=1 Tax=Chitinophaga agrisoli TaxID=2607653 RepID=A0A5B2VPH2_9BACT|nr:AraC family transcriptional regulator [Chitinophaga agrisoli]KAA2240172.1 helix-turn-helix transcriptional regulator [Chitinophaga agrisoli]